MVEVERKQHYKPNVTVALVFIKLTHRTPASRY